MFNLLSLFCLLVNPFLLTFWSWPMTYWKPTCLIKNFSYEEWWLWLLWSSSALIFGLLILQRKKDGLRQWYLEEENLYHKTTELYEAECIINSGYNRDIALETFLFRRSILAWETSDSSSLLKHRAKKLKYVCVYKNTYTKVIGKSCRFQFYTFSGKFLSFYLIFFNIHLFVKLEIVVAKRIALSLLSHNLMLI